MQTRKTTEKLGMLISSVRSVVLLELHRSTWTSWNLPNFFSSWNYIVQHGHLEISKTSLPLLQNIPFSPCKLGMRQKSSKMLHFMRSIRCTPGITSFNKDILKSPKLLFPLLQNRPFSPCKLGMRQKSSKCSISSVRSVVLLELHRSTWTSWNLQNFFSRSCKTDHFHHAN